MLIRLRAAADMVFLPPPLGLAGLAAPTPVRALMAASRRLRSARSCWTICSFGMRGMVALYTELRDVGYSVISPEEVLLGFVVTGERSSPKRGREDSRCTTTRFSCYDHYSGAMFDPCLLPHSGGAGGKRKTRPPGHLKAPPGPVGLSFSGIRIYCFGLISVKEENSPFPLNHL